MSMTTQHVIRSSDGWSVMRGGAKRASRTFKTQKEAISYAKKISKKQGAALYIHRSDGMIREKNLYGSNPHAPRDGR